MRLLFGLFRLKGVLGLLLLLTTLGQWLVFGIRLNNIPLFGVHYKRIYRLPLSFAYGDWRSVLAPFQQSYVTAPWTWFIEYQIDVCM